MQLSSILQRGLTTDEYFEWTAAQHEEEASAEHQGDPIAPTTASAVAT